MDQKEIKRKIRKHFELSKNEIPKYQNMWDKVKAMLRRKFIELDTSIRNKERSQIIDLSFPFMKQEEQIKPKVGEEIN